jgi:hypothetical protein
MGFPGVSNLIGKAIDIATDALGLPEPLGDAAKIGVGLVTSNPLLVADGVADIAPDVLQFLTDELHLGGAEPSEPDTESPLKTLFNHGLELLQKELARSAALPAAA